MRWGSRSVWALVTPPEAKNIDDCNILVCTSEKLDSLLRHRAELVSDLCCVVADEFHLMNDGTRGHALDQPYETSTHQTRRSNHRALRNRWQLPTARRMAEC